MTFEEVLEGAAASSLEVQSSQAELFGGRSGECDAAFFRTISISAFRPGGSLSRKAGNYRHFQGASSRRKNLQTDQADRQSALS